MASSLSMPFYALSNIPGTEGENKNHNSLNAQKHYEEKGNSFLFSQRPWQYSKYWNGIAGTSSLFIITPHLLFTFTYSSSTFSALLENFILVVYDEMS